jgi:hypothetical protein
MLSVFMISTAMVGLQATDAVAQSRTKGQELEQRQNKRTDDWAAKQKQQVREEAESRANTRGVGQEKRIQDREREIDKQAAQRRKDDTEARSRLPKEKLDEPFKEKKPEPKTQPKKR